MLKNSTMSRLEIFRQRAYALYFLGTTVSMIGTGMQFVANTWLALQLVQANYAVAVILICSSLPGVLLSPLIGIIVDRFDRKFLAATMDLMRASVLFIVTAIWWLKLILPWYLYVMAFLIAIGDEVYKPSVLALVREIIPEDMLLTANATTGIANQIGALVGAGVSGIIIMIFSPVMILIINAVSFLFSATCILNMRKGVYLSRHDYQPGKGIAYHLEDFKRGLHYIRLHSAIIPSYLIMLALIALLRTLNVLLAPFAEEVLHVGVQGFGYIDASFAGGAIIGGLVLPALSSKYNVQKVAFGGLLLLIANLIIFAFSQQIIVAMVSYFIIGMMFQIRILHLTLAQQKIDIAYQGRVHSTFNTLFAIAALIIYFLVGIVSGIISLRWVYIAQAVILVVVAVSVYIIDFTKQKTSSHGEES